MNKVLLGICTMTLSLSGFAQIDTVTVIRQQQADTIIAGNFIIIKKDKNTSSVEKDNTLKKEFDIVIGKDKTRKKNVSTQWLTFDLGFANFRDKTNYTEAQSVGYFQQPSAQTPPVNANSFDLRTGKSSNVNIWIFMQKRNLLKTVLNLKYGIGLEMYNFRYDSRINYEQDPQAYVFNDTISFSKNKLALSYISLPVMLNLTTRPNSKNSLVISAGMSFGYLYNSHDKQKSNERGKEKTHGNFNLEPWRIAAIAEIGYGPVKLYSSYSINNLYKKDKTGLEQYPYAVGLRLVAPHQW